MKQQTAMQELIHWLEVRLRLYPAEPTPCDKAAYDAYVTILIIAKSKLNYERECMISYGNEIQAIKGEGYNYDPVKYFNETFGEG